MQRTRNPPGGLVRCGNSCLAQQRSAPSPDDLLLFSPTEERGAFLFGLVVSDLIKLMFIRLPRWGWGMQGGCGRHRVPQYERAEGESWN